MNVERENRIDFEKEQKLLEIGKEVEKLEDFYNKIREKVNVVKELSTTWYGMNEFYIRDNNGYILGFSEQKE